MTDPFRIEGPACISFSGGRTSAYMLRRILDSTPRRTMADVVVCFANTGKELPETLKFVEECSQRWGVRIAWLEYRPHANGARRADRFREVTYQTAARDGEPFDAIIEKRGMVPRPRIRFCTEILKIRVMRDWMLSHGFQWWRRVVGLRADESNRAMSAEESGHEKGDVLIPLFYANITEADVLAFWKRQPFDLGLNTWEGNCDLCHLKSQAKRLRIMRDRPELAAWWLERDKIGKGFRPGDPSYAKLMERARLPVLPGILDGEESVSCGCTD